MTRHPATEGNDLRPNRVDAQTDVSVAGASIKDAASGVYIQDTEPSSPPAGARWTDTSTNPPRTKIYDDSSGTWIPINAGDRTFVSDTEPTNLIQGDIWFDTTPADGTRVYWFNGTSLESLNFLSAIPDTADHYFTFENDLTDLVGSLNASANGTTFTDAPSLDGQSSLRASGSGETVDLNSRVDVDATNDIAFSMLVRFDSVSSDTGVFSVDDSGGNGSFDLAIQSGSLQFNYRNNGSNAPVSQSIDANTTYEVTCQYDHDNAETKLALDGTVVGTNSGSQIDGATQNINGLMKTHVFGNNVGIILDNFAVHGALLL